MVGAAFLAGAFFLWREFEAINGVRLGLQENSGLQENNRDSSKKEKEKDSLSVEESEPVSEDEKEVDSGKDAALEEFDSELVNLSFSYPKSSAYREEDLFAQKNSLLGNLEHSGKKVNFSDKNNLMPEFSAVTEDFSADDLVTHDLIEGSLASKESFQVKGYEPDYSKVIEKEKGIYQFIGYKNQECSPAVNSYLFVSPPENSNLKYISFYLGSAGEFDSSSCVPEESLIKSKIEEIANGGIEKINLKLQSALRVAKTFVTS